MNHDRLKHALFTVGATVLLNLNGMIRFRRDEFACEKCHVLPAYGSRRDKIAGNAPPNGGAHDFGADNGATPSLLTLSYADLSRNPREGGLEDQRSRAGLEIGSSS